LAAIHLVCDMLPKGRVSIFVLVAVFSTFLFLGYITPYLSSDVPSKGYSSSKLTSELVVSHVSATASDLKTAHPAEPSSYVLSQTSENPSYFISDTSEQPSDGATSESSTASISSKAATREIPNIVHFVHLVPPAVNGTSHSINFEFQQFIAIYSAYLYLKPDIIYIHTNANSKQIRAARHNSPNKWTSLIANIPKVTFSYEKPPYKTTSNKKIEKLAHQSDFVRTRVMKRLGGIYLDEDAYVIRDVVALRQAGFRNVVGKQTDSMIACGMWLSTPENHLITAYQALQDRTFNGGWTTHSVELLTRLVSEFVASDREVLILEQDALFPLSWKGSDLTCLYQVNNGTKVNETTTAQDTRFNITSYIDSFELWPAKTWERNWGHSYALHGYNSEIKNAKAGFGEFGGITLQYVLARNSNFARAVYPAVKHAMDNGFLQ
jgi:hypothetical protein